jgi:hypothetical protein
MSACTSIAGALKISLRDGCRCRLHQPAQQVPVVAGFSLRLPTGAEKTQPEGCGDERRLVGTTSTARGVVVGSRATT